MRGLVVVVVAAYLPACGFEHGALGPRSDAALTDGDVPGDAAIDAELDARMLVCPVSYNVTTANTTSRYRVITSTAAFATQHQDCNNDQAGDTHLASIESVSEATALQVVLGGGAATNYYIGAAQKPSQPLVTDGWFVFSGASLPEGLWASGQPNDDAAGESNEENLLALHPTDLFHDSTGDVAYPAVCECDGLPIDPVVAGYIP